jgi:protocatechuate 3,4-dioxygenase beta subunit
MSIKRISGDDRQLGRVLSRRDVLRLLGASGAVMLAGWPAESALARPGCVARPQQTEGPYFVDESLNRSDIRSDPSDGSVKPGTPLEIAFEVSRLSPGGCEPLAGAIVHLWHCDHLGVYSDVEDPGFNTVGKKFLRGYQVTDARGVARFQTIYPGWYHGRTVHVHFKIRSAPSAAPGYEFVSQLYFDDSLTDEVHARQPYAANGRRNRRNSGDGIFSRGGSQLLLAPVRSGQGYAATFPIALQTT